MGTVARTRKNSCRRVGTGYASGLREYNLETLLAKKPNEVIVRAVERMLPKNRMNARLMKHLHVHAGATHKQQAQNPVPLTLN